MTNPDTTALNTSLQVLLQELSASGSQIITDPVTGNPMTLREAVARILWKEAFLLPLVDRPRPPTQSDDQYGHVLSARAEGLVTQAILADLAAALGRDVTTLRKNAIASLNNVNTTSTPPAS